jgi:hypothetical protein
MEYADAASSDALNRSMEDMSEHFARLDLVVHANPMPPEFSNWRSSITCQVSDCRSYRGPLTCGVVMYLFLVAPGLLWEIDGAISLPLSQMRALRQLQYSCLSQALRRTG